jgi:hypothetical protein
MLDDERDGSIQFFRGHLRFSGKGKGPDQYTINALERLSAMGNCAKV